MTHLRLFTFVFFALVFLIPAHAVFAIDLQVPLPGIGGSVSGFPEYIEAWYRILIGAIGVVSTVMIMIGGFQWIFAAGNASTIDSAKTTIFSAIAGLLIALGSFTILNIINPNLVSLQVPALTQVERDDFDFASMKGCSSYKRKKNVTFSKTDTERECGQFYSVSYIVTDKKTGKEEAVTKECAGEFCEAKKGPCKKGKSTWVCINDALLCDKTQAGSQGQDIDQCFSFDKTFEEIGSSKICGAQLGHGVAGCVGLSSVQCPPGGSQVACSACAGISDCVDPDSGNVASKNLGEINYLLPSRVTGKNICCDLGHKKHIVCNPTDPSTATRKYRPLPCIQYEAPPGVTQYTWCRVDYGAGGNTPSGLCLNNLNQEGYNYICSSNTCWIETKAI